MTDAARAPLTWETRERVVLEAVRAAYESGQPLDKSIDVAKVTGVPAAVVTRSLELLLNSDYLTGEIRAPWNGPEAATFSLVPTERTVRPSLPSGLVEPGDVRQRARQVPLGVGQQPHLLIALDVAPVVAGELRLQTVHGRGQPLRLADRELPGVAGERRRSRSTATATCTRTPRTPCPPSRDDIHERGTGR